MKTISLLAAALAIALAACSQDPAPPAQPTPPAAGKDADDSKGFIGRHLDQAIAEARKELATENIGLNGNFDINVNGRQIHHGGSDNLPKAEITPQGDLLIEGKAVTIDATQRRQLLAYRGQIIGIADAGMAIGAQGADLAGEALSGVVGVIFGGKDAEKEFEQRMEAEGEKIKVEALKICALLPGMLEQQQQLAASLPAFQPYARMTQEDVDECGKDEDGSGVAVSSKRV